MRIGHCQFSSTCGDLDRNLDRFQEGLARADRERVEIVSFPECFLTGYPDDGERARAGAFAADSPTMMRVLDATTGHEATAIVGFNELRGDDLYNSAAVVHRGHLLGIYSKCFAYQPFHKQGRAFPVFERRGVTFGVVICADGGYIEPSRILALKGAKIIFAPHFNYIQPAGLIAHFAKVRADHTARAVENAVYFVRGNNVSLAGDDNIRKASGVGYGDSYIVDPQGEIIVRSRRHVEDFIFADVDTSYRDTTWGVGRSRKSIRELSQQLLEAARQATD